LAIAWNFKVYTTYLVILCRVAQKSKPLPNDQTIVLNRIKAGNCD